MEPTAKRDDGTQTAPHLATHPFDLSSLDGLDLFAEEDPGGHETYELMPPNTFSTLACECETISTFFCYGCGA